ncbi:hypothetical protein UFOVP760_93 [uncultured Caudovirales phage]|uniref:Uncharacterized protein n=1 Tax=uncultured Caudovirales phage TaxID=2100421 RepID=A0A6J7X996_9CAUD|nr:hypothetical protein UFOVP760_93 [uncultured Caudovirales phage]
MNVNYTLKNLYPGIYLCSIKDMYDLAMTFCRVQEFYESPIKQIKGQKFSLIELMSLYAKRNGNVFTYPEDWGGFNVPGPVISNLFKLGIDDYNQYDDIIESIHKKINKEIPIPNHYYLIGSDDDKKTIEHEVCHALYFLDKDYKKKVNSIIKKLIPSARKKAVNVLFQLGYDKSVINDELQAYFSTEFLSLKSKTKLNKKELDNITDVVLELKNNFKEFKKKIKI